MKRLQRLLSLIITLVMLFALTGVLHAAPVSSYGYHNGGNNGSSYSWTYNSTSQELSIEMGSTNNSVNEISDEIWSNAAKVYVDTSIALSYVKIRDLKENTPVIITSSGEGYYSYIVLDGVSSSNTLKCAAKIGYFQLKNYESTELMTVLKSEEFVASSCGFDIKSNTTSIFNTPSDADQYSWFQYRGKVNSVNIPDGLKTVPAFYLSTNLNLTSVDASLNNTLTTIEYYSFANCSSLTNVSLPGTLTTIKPDAFANDPCLTDIKFDGTREQWDNITMEFTDSDGVVYFKGLILKNKVQVHFKDGSIKTMEAKANIIDDETGKFVTQSALMYEYYDTAGNFAWRYYYDKTLHVTLQSYNADSLSTAALSEFPEVLSNAKSLFIDKQASIQFGTLELSNLAGVNRVYLGATSPYNVKLNSMNSINDVFNYSDINNVVILRLNGWTCTSTPFFVDKNNKSIVYINGALPNSVITIAKGCEDPYVFNYCDKLRLEEARFEDGIETIPNSALQGNNKLTDVSIPNSVTEIEYEAFASCESLAKINIPTSVKKIGYNAFRDNKSFTDIYYNGPMAKWNQIDISGTYFVGAGPETQKIDGMVSKNLVTVHCSDGNIILPGRDDDLNITIPVPPLVVTPSPTGEPTGTPTQPPTQAPTSTATPTPTEEGFEAFVERLYTVALGRASEPEGKAFWCEHVGNGDLNGAQCANEFLLSKEFKDRKLSDEEFLKVLYRTFFDRDATADPDGFNFWMNSLKTQGRDTVVDCFINSTEWCNVCASFGVKSGATRAKATVPSKNAKDFADRLYTKCLGRPAEEEGLMFWALGLTNLELTGKQAAHEFFFSKEFNDHNYDDKELLTRMYRTFMGREPDDDGMNYWLKEMKNGVTKEQVFNSFVNSAEFTQICKDYAIERG